MFSQFERTLTELPERVVELIIQMSAGVINPKNHLNFICQLQESINEVQTIKDPTMAMVKLKKLLPAVPSGLPFPGFRNKGLEITEIDLDSINFHSTKDRPIFFSVRCQDIVRQLMFKFVRNSAIEAVLTQSFARILDEKLLSTPGTNFEESVKIYTVIPLSREVLMIEIVENVNNLEKVTSIADIANDVDPDLHTEQFMKKVYLEFFNNFYEGADATIWAMRKKDLNNSIAFWNLMGFLFDIGDRNLKNFLIGDHHEEKHATFLLCDL